MRLFRKPEAMPVQLPSLLKNPPLDEKTLDKVLKAHLEHEGVQALIQVLEEDAAKLNARTLDVDNLISGRSVNYGGGAEALFHVLEALRKL